MSLLVVWRKILCIYVSDVMFSSFIKTYLVFFSIIPVGANCNGVLHIHWDTPCEIVLETSY